MFEIKFVHINVFRTFFSLLFVLTTTFFSGDFGLELLLLLHNALERRLATTLMTLRLIWELAKDAYRRDLFFIKFIIHNKN